MIASLLAGALGGLLAVALAWCVIPAPTYVEDALGLMLVAFAGAFVVGALAYRRLRRPPT
jgi:hypothetical protein